MVTATDVTGVRFGRLIATCVTHVQRPDGRKQRCWICTCDCGGKTTVPVNRLISGETTSCGCYKLIPARAAKTTHGHAGKGKRTAEYKVWCSMKDRCYNKRNKHYKDYGGRGIAMSAEWKSSYAAFIASMGPRPTHRHSIDRINNEQGYEPGNCRWATHHEQAANKRPKKRTYRIIVDGQPLHKLALDAGLDPITVRRRFRSGVRGADLLKPDLRTGIWNIKRKGIPQPDIERGDDGRFIGRKRMSGKVERW